MIISVSAGLVPQESSMPVCGGVAGRRKGVFRRLSVTEVFLGNSFLGSDGLELLTAIEM